MSIGHESKKPVSNTFIYLNLDFLVMHLSIVLFFFINSRPGSVFLSTSNYHFLLSMLCRY